MSGGNPFDFDDTAIPTGVPVSTSSIYYLDEEEFQKVKKSADSGNIGAMLKLHKFYEMSEFKDQSSLEWLLKAAEAGDLESQYGVAILFMNSKHFELAKLWANKAKEGGHEHAVSLIESISEK